ncbi:MAG: DUF3667 domain-containing protein [Pirellulaceae bacterium]
MWELLAEFLQSIVQIDGKFPATLRRLMLNPGFLTKEYLSGRKVRHLRPITVATLSAGLFFLALETNSAPIPDSVTDLGFEAGETVDINLGPGLSFKLKAEDFAELGNSTYDERVELLKSVTDAPLNATQVFFGERVLRILGDGGLLRFQQGLFRMASRTLVVLIPASAWLVFVAHWRWDRSRRPYYSETVVYSLHVHSFFFVIFSLCQVPLGDLLSGYAMLLPFPLTVWYVVTSLRKSFGRTWIANIIRGLLLISLQVLLIFIVTVLASLLVLALM